MSEGSEFSDAAPASELFWVFGYGSLMWQPGFPHRAERTALLRGYHRSFCIYSRHYRGTHDAPGLVLGLDRGGACRGVAFGVDPGDQDRVKAYLAERELSGYAYVARLLRVEIDGLSVRAYTFVADRCHSNYAGDLDIDRAAEIIMRARGNAGLNRDYLIRTVRCLEKGGYFDRNLHALLERVERMTGVLDAGSGI